MLLRSGGRGLSPAGPGVGRARTPWRARLLLLAGSLLLSFVVAELVLRQVVPTTNHDQLIQRSADPVLDFELRPGADLEFDGITLKIPATHVRVSSQSARGPDLAIPKPTGTRRLVCIGDSVAFGWGVGEQQTACAVLASTLGPEWQPVNLGVPGYGAAQKRRQLELRGLAFQPDLVLAQFDQNDRDPPDPQAENASVWAWLVDHSAVFRFVHIQLFLSGEGPTGEGRETDGREGPEGRGTDGQGTDPGSGTDGQGTGPGSRTDGQGTNAGSGTDGQGTGGQGTDPGSRTDGQGFDGEGAVVTEFLVLATRCKEAGVPLVVTLRATEQDAAFMAALEQVGVRVVDVGPALRGAPPETLEIPGDGHPTAEGHRRIAAALLPAIRAALAH